MSAGQIDRNGEMKMESEKKTETEIGSFLKTGVDYLKALDFEIGSETKYKVKGSDTVNFGEGDKLLLLLTGIEGEETGLVLNRSNIEFLKTEGYIYPRELIGKTIPVYLAGRHPLGCFDPSHGIIISALLTSVYFSHIYSV